MLFMLILCSVKLDCISRLLRLYSSNPHLLACCPLQFNIFITSLKTLDEEVVSINPISRLLPSLCSAFHKSLFSRLPCFMSLCVHGWHPACIMKCGISCVAAKEARRVPCMGMFLCWETGQKWLRTSHCLSFKAYSYHCMRAKHQSVPDQTLHLSLWNWCRENEILFIKPAERFSNSTVHRLLGNAL